MSCRQDAVPMTTVNSREDRVMKSALAQRTRATAFCLSFVLLLCPAISLAQVENGSFEIDGQSSLSGWRFTCAGAASEDAPSGGGTWSLKLAPGNVQGCSPGLALQAIPTVRSGEVWRLTAWVKQSPVTFSPVSIYWQIVTAGGNSIRRAAEVTTAQTWTQLTVVDTLSLAPGDSAMIVLDAGGTSGPAISGAGASFDLVSVERVEATPVPYEEAPQPGLFDLSQNFPNPFDGATTISFHLSRPDYARLDVYDVLGRKVETLLAGYLPGGAHQAAWHATGLPPGMYFGRLQADQEVRVLKMTLLR